MKKVLSHKEIEKLIGNKNHIILEIGSNVGRDTQRFLDTFHDAYIYCFEPDYRCIRKFKKRIQSNRLSLIEKAVSDKDGKDIFYFSGGSRPGHKSQHINSSSLIKPKNHLKYFPWCTFKDSAIIETITLDSWYSHESFVTIDFVWADVQGAEEKMIRGGFDALSNTRYLYTEYHDDELYEGQINLKNIMNLLPNFEIEVKFPTNVLLRNKKYN